jgi:secondary thiamine-phosphate synthase enzyme
MGRVGYPPVREIQVTTERKTQLLDITADVRDAVGSDAEGSAALVYVPHTTAGVTINEKIDPDLLDDFEMALSEIVDDGWSWRHVDADGPNAPSHVRASMLGPQVLVPLQGGELALGTYQGIFFCEFDGPRSRKVYVSTLI